MRWEVTSLLQEKWRFFSRRKLVLAFFLFQVLEEKIVQEYKKFRKVRQGLGMVARRQKW